MHYRDHRLAMNPRPTRPLGIGQSAPGLKP